MEGKNNLIGKKVNFYFSAGNSEVAKRIAIVLAIEDNQFVLLNRGIREYIPKNRVIRIEVLNDDRDTK